jgi:predicted enzyme related to lactoylglutathione lyase
MAPTEMALGRFAALIDPQGGAFTVLQQTDGG